MFSGINKRGSLRKVLCKRNKSESISSPGANQEQMQMKAPLTPTIVEPSIGGESPFALYTSSNDASSAAQASPSPRSPLMGNSPLMVEVDCVCNNANHQRSKAGGSKGHRLFAPQLSGPAEMCRVHGYEQHHHRSISASPQYHSTPTSAQSSDTQLNVPLLIPLGGSSAKGVTRAGKGSLRGVAQHRMSLSGFAPPTSSRPSSTNIYLATLDHPTVFDFEDWHTSLDLSKK